MLFSTTRSINRFDRCVMYSFRPSTLRSPSARAVERLTVSALPRSLLAATLTASCLGMFEILGLVFAFVIALRVMWFLFGLAILFSLDLDQPYDPDYPDGYR